MSLSIYLFHRVPMLNVCRTTTSTLTFLFSLQDGNHPELLKSANHSYSVEELCTGKIEEVLVSDYPRDQVEYPRSLSSSNENMKNVLSMFNHRGSY